MRVFIIVSIGFFLALSLISCSSNSTNEPAVDSAFHELEIKRIAIYDLMAVFKDTDNTGGERIEEFYTSFGVYMMSATKSENEFKGETTTNVMAEEKIKVSLRFDNDARPRRITNIKMDEHSKVEGQLTMHSGAGLKDVEIHSSELKDMDITILRSGQSVCNYITNFSQHVKYDWGLESELQSFRCTENTQLDIEIIGKGRSGI